MKPLRLLVGVGVLFASLGCAAPVEEPPPEVDENVQLDAIRDVIGRYVAAYNENDSEALTRLFTEDAIRMPPERPSYSGHSRIRSEFDATFEQGIGAVVINLQETVLGDHIAFARGTWAVTSDPPEGEPQTAVGKWIALLRQGEDDSWKMSRYIWNRDAPNET